MSRGPAYYKSKGACIYCGATGVRLTNEHIVPFSLGGSHVIREASCLRCANTTKKFEQRVARDLWGDARTSYNAPTRRKRERRSHIVVADPDNRTKSLTVPASEYPGGLVFYKMNQAGLLQGLPESLDISGLWQLVVIHDEERQRKFLQKHPGKLTLKFRHVPEAFGQLIAKIGYCQILTHLDLGDFRPICLPYIT
jgi:HNH endonuclease